MIFFARYGGSLFPPDDWCEGWNKRGQMITIDDHNGNATSVAPLRGVGNRDQRGVYSLKKTELQLVIVEG